MQDNKFPPGYVPMTHHNLAGFSANGEGRVSKSRSGGDQNYNNNGGSSGRPQRQDRQGGGGAGPKRRPMKPRMNVGGRD